MVKEVVDYMKKHNSISVDTAKEYLSKLPKEMNVIVPGPNG